MKIKILAVMLAVIGASGCASNKEIQQAYYTQAMEQRKELIKARVAMAQKSLCKLECPPEGCKIQTFECNAPEELNIPNIQAPTSDSKYWSEALVKTFAIAAPVYLGVQGFNAIKNTAIGLGNTLGSPSYTYTNSYNEGTMFGDGVMGSGQVGDYKGNNLGDGVLGSGQVGDYKGNNLGDGLLGDGVVGSGQFGDTDNRHNYDYTETVTP